MLYYIEAVTEQCTTEKSLEKCFKKVLRNLKKVLDKRKKL